MIDWHQAASRLLRLELAKQDISYKKLVILLDQIGIQETDSSITNKLARGKFSLAFFLACMTALGHTKVEIDLPPKSSDS